VFARVEGLHIFGESLDSLYASGSRPHDTWARGLMSDVLAWAGRPSEAMATLNEALALSASTGIRWFGAELHRRKGQLQLSDSAVAEQEFRRAIEIARNQSAKLFELRASVSLARLWLQQARRASAQALLAPVCA
jgi:predicted ATPase